MSSFPFDPGSSRIPLTATNGLEKLSKALYERPGLEVEIRGGVAIESDGLAIKKQKLNRALQQLRWEELRASAQAETKPEDIILSPDIRTAVLRKYYVQIFPDDARSTRPPPGLEESFYERMNERLLDELKVKDQDFRQLATARAQAIKIYLIEKGSVAPERLFYTEGDSMSTEEGSKVLVQLQ